jgi:hypothetical protein
VADRERQLRKKELRSQMRELRKLWNEYDPIGAVENSDIDDEYEAFVGPHLSLLARGVSDEVIFEHIKGEVTGHIGMTWSPYLAEKTKAFVNRSRDWFDSKSIGKKLH